MSVKLARVLPLFLVAATAGLSAHAESKGSTIHYPQGLYVDTFWENCTDMGGSTDSKEEGHSSCTLPSGTTVDCGNDSSGLIEVCVSSRKVPEKEQGIYDTSGQVIDDGALDTVKP